MTGQAVQINPRLVLGIPQEDKINTDRPYGMASSITVYSLLIKAMFFAPVLGGTEGDVRLRMSATAGGLPQNLSLLSSEINRTTATVVPRAR